METREAHLQGALARLSSALPLEVASPELIRTARLLIRPLDETDRTAYLNAIETSRRELDEWSKLYHEDESDDAFFQRQLDLTRRGSATGCAWRRIALLDGQIVGGFNLNSIVRGMECHADANWWMATPHAGKGLATEGISAMVAYAMGDLPQGLGLHTVYAWIQRTNNASIRVAQKSGFTRVPDRDFLLNGDNWLLHDCYAVRLGAAGDES